MESKDKKTLITQTSIVQFIVQQIPGEYNNTVCYGIPNESAPTVANIIIIKSLTLHITLYIHNYGKPEDINANIALI